MAKPVHARSVEPERVEWLWMNRIPKGMITVVAGKPDQGKGLFGAMLAADVSSNGGNVLFSAAEDSPGLMTRPRLEAAGADLDRVLLWRFQLPKNMKEFQQLVVDEEIALVVMDPFASHLSNGISRHSDNVRSVLSPVTELIEHTKTAVVVIEHALKRVPANGHVLNAIGGSGSGLPAASRAAFVFGVNPDDDSQRVLAPAKFNVGPKPKALTLDVDVVDTSMVADVPFLEVDDELKVFDPMRMFAKEDTNKRPGPSTEKRAAAAEWLTGYLAQNGQTKAGVVQEDAKQRGMSAKTLRRAADDMGIVRNPPGGGRNCSWDLPDDVKGMLGLPVIAQPEDGGSDVDKLIGELLGGDGDA